MSNDLLLYKAADDTCRYGSPLTLHSCILQVFPGGMGALIVRSNLTIRGRPGAYGAMPVMDFNFMLGRVRFMPGTVITFQELCFRNIRSRPGLSADLYLHSPGAALLGDNTIIWQPVCVPVNMGQFLSQPRPTAYPGQQQAQFVQQPFCYRDRCWPDSVTFQDYAVGNVAPQAEGQDEVKHTHAVLLITHSVAAP
jgi:hypothetical protein